MTNYLALYIEFQDYNVIIAIIKEEYTHIATDYFLNKLPAHVSWDYIPITDVDGSHIYTNYEMAKLGTKLQEQIK